MEADEEGLGVSVLVVWHIITPGRRNRAVGSDSSCQTMTRMAVHLSAPTPQPRVVPLSRPIAALLHEELRRVQIFFE